MIYLKQFESIEAINDIRQWCKKYNIVDYTINDDNSIDVNNNVNLYGNFYNISKLPYKFNVINGSFYCNDNNLVTLKNCPDIIMGHFSCNNNVLTSLIGGPKKVYGKYDIGKNMIYTLNGMTTMYGISFDQRNDMFNYKLTPLAEILDQIGNLNEFVELYPDYSPIKGNVINKTRMDNLLDEMGESNFDYRDLKSYIIK